MTLSPPDSPSHVHDPRRLEVLESTQLLDSGPEAAFDRLTRLAAQLVSTPAAQINLIDTRRQFFKSDYQRDALSNAGGEVPLSQSFCQYVVAEQDVLVVPDAREHPVLRSNGSVLSGAVVSYVGVPLTTSDGLTLGSLCAFDTEPRTWPLEHVALLRELAALTMTEIELRRTAKQLETNYTELQTLELQRAELVNMLVHDLRNPLTSVLGGLDLIESAAGLSQETREDVELARGGAQAVIQMVTEMLEVSKAEAGRLGLTLMTTTAEDVIALATRRLRHLAITQGLTLRVCSDAASVPLCVDVGKVSRVLVNLIANAIQHSSEGSEIVISAMLDEVQREWTFQVQDRGPGIPPEVLPRLFEKFQTARVRESRHASTGLGLSFCKMVVEAHGGTIRAENAVAGGALFSFTVPAKIADECLPARKS